MWPFNKIWKIILNIRKIHKLAYHGSVDEKGNIKLEDIVPGILGKGLIYLEKSVPSWEEFIHERFLYGYTLKGKDLILTVDFNLLRRRDKAESPSGRWQPGDG